MGKPTHWAQIVLLVKEDGRVGGGTIEKGETVTASFGYSPDPDNARSIVVTGSWRIGEGGKEMSQKWKI